MALVVTAIETQGRYDEGRGVEFAAAYKIEYWRSSIDRWVQYRDDAGLMVSYSSISTARTYELKMPPVLSDAVEVEIDTLNYQRIFKDRL